MSMVALLAIGAGFLFVIVIIVLVVLFFLQDKK